MEIVKANIPLSHCTSKYLLWGTFCTWNKWKVFCKEINWHRNTLLQLASLIFTPHFNTHEHIICHNHIVTKYISIHQTKKFFLYTKSGSHQIHTYSHHAPMHAHTHAHHNYILIPSFLHFKTSSICYIGDMRQSNVNKRI